ncbi:hypothetical protein ABGB12_05330 [Actinocorallia sp. B10E7]|uniref:hypothetical protein n=1 Tax=Actinocorallia sp. B10E7 TaxID=3153558 RepID=UPI00325F54E4
MGTVHLRAVENRCDYHVLVRDGQNPDPALTFLVPAGRQVEVAGEMVFPPVGNPEELHRAFTVTGEDGSVAHWLYQEANRPEGNEIRSASHGDYRKSDLLARVPDSSRVSLIVEPGAVSVAVFMEDETAAISRDFD